MKETNPSANPYAKRLASFEKTLARRRLSAAIVHDQANIRGLTGIDCDNGCLLVRPGERPVFHTDFRYVPMVHRVAPWLKVVDIKKVPELGLVGRVGIEFSMAHLRFERLSRAFRKAKFVDVLTDIGDLRAVKTEDEIARLRASERLDCEIWREASARFRPGMSELDMARLIKTMMIERGEGEAFETIVCVGANAAECHHVPDETIWNGRDPILVDMGVKLGGYCSDLTRNLVPKSASSEYRKVYDIVRRANAAAIEAARPGMTCAKLDAVARRLIAREGFGRCFGHSLGHGVGIEIHEAPTLSKKGTTELRPGMVVTIEPGIYVEGKLGVRIEDLILITESGCEVLSV